MFWVGSLQVHFLMEAIEGVFADGVPATSPGGDEACETGDETSQPFSAALSPFDLRNDSLFSLRFPGFV